MESNAQDGSSFTSVGDTSDVSDRRFKNRMIEADDERSFPERSVSTRPAVQRPLKPGAAKGGTVSGGFSPNAPVADLVKFIVKDKLQIPVDPTRFTTALRVEKQLELSLISDFGF